MNRRVLYFGVSIILSLTIMLAFVLPWSIGYFSRLTILEKLDVLKTNTQYNFTLKNIQSGVYHSQAQIEISSKNLYQGSPKILIFVQQDIQHGPFIWDKNKKVLFKLAKITSQILPQDTDFIKFDQKNISLVSKLSYRRNENFLTQLDKISGKIFFKNHSYTFSAKNLEITSNLGLSNWNILQNLYIKELIVSSASTAFAKIQDFNIHNPFNDKSGMLNTSQDNILCDKIEIVFKKNKLMLDKFQMNINIIPEKNKENIQLEAQVNFKKLSINDKVYGPLSSTFSLSPLPKKFLKTTSLMEKLHILEQVHTENSNMLLSGKNVQETQGFYNKNLLIRHIDFIVKSFTLYVPGGTLSLTGTYTLALGDNDRLPYHHWGRMMLRIPKETLYQTFRQPDINALLESNLILDIDNSFNLYLLFKNGITYINGQKSNEFLNTRVNALKSPLNKEQALFIALLEENNRRIETLIAEGVNLELPLWYGKTPLHLAGYLGNIEAVKLFLAATPKVLDLPDEQGNTTLYWAARFGYQDIVQALVARNAMINTKNNNGWTPLQEAAENGHANIVDLLIAKGAQINTQDNEGRTALFWAAKEGHAEIIQFLLNKGADPCLYNVRNLSPLDIARQNKRVSAAILLSQFQNCNR